MWQFLFKFKNTSDEILKVLITLQYFKKYRVWVTFAVFGCPILIPLVYLLKRFSYYLTFQSFDIQHLTEVIPETLHEHSIRYICSYSCIWIDTSSDGTSFPEGFIRSVVSVSDILVVDLLLSTVTLLLLYPWQ